MEVRVFSSAFDLVDVTNELFCLGMSNVVRNLTIYVYVDTLCSK
jgi:hypothetical protein